MKKVVATVIAIFVILNMSCLFLTASATVYDLDTDFSSIENDFIFNENIHENACFDMDYARDSDPDDKYVSATFDKDLSILDKNNSYFVVHLENDAKFDYVNISFVSSENIMLSNYADEIYNYDEDAKQVVVNFRFNTAEYDCNSIPTYYDALFGKVFIFLRVYADQKVVDSSVLSLSLLNTAQGIFLSEFGDVYAYDNYIVFLRENLLITDEQYKNISKNVTKLLEIKTDKNSSHVSNEIVVRYFDSSQKTVNTSSVYRLSELPDLIFGDMSYSVVPRSTTTSGTIVAPSLTVTRTISALNSGDQLFVYGYVRWTDIEGTTHPAQKIQVQIIDEDVFSDNILATVNTNNNGYYSATVDNQTGAGDNGCDIFIRVNTKNDNFTIGTNVLSSMFSDGYYFVSDVTDDVLTSQPQVTYSGSNSDAFRAVSVHQAFVVGYYYYELMNNDSVNSISIVYPGGTDGSWSSSFWNLINIEYGDYCDWDPILHELGHQVASKIGVSNSFSDSHRMSENLSETYGKSKGIKGAWSEGWASYFSMAAQMYYNNNVSTISSITNVADCIYTDLVFTETSTTFTGWSKDYQNEVGCTEGNELAVTAVLLSLIIDSKIGLSHQTVWNIAKSSGCDCFFEFVDTLYDTVDKNLYSAIGYHLERHNIADTPTVTTSLYSRNTPGKFYWTPASTQDNINDNNNYIYYNQAKITFFDKNYNIVLQAPYISSALGSYGAPINSVQWTALTQSIGTGEHFYWCISTFQNDNPATGPYFSTLHKAYFSEDITLIEYTNTIYNGQLSAYSDVAFKFVVPASGYYAFSSTGSTDVNVTIYQNSILEGRAIDNDDGGSGLNFLYTTYLNSGTTVYIIVGGYHSASGTFGVLVTKYSGISINTPNSVTVNGTDGVWYRFVAPTNGNYTFYTTGNIDVYGELFYYPVQNESTSGQLIYDDDSGTGRNTSFTYNLTSNKAVYVRIRGYSASVNGNCSLKIVPTTVISELDTTYTGSISANGYTIYKFSAPSSGRYTFYTTGNIDTYIDVFDTPVINRDTIEDRLAYDDDSGASHNASAPMVLSQNQTVFIRVRGYSASTSGNYGFAVVKSVIVTNLGMGYTGVLDSGSMLWYSFTATDSGDYTFYTTGDVDTYGDALEYFVPDGGVSYLICSNDDDEIIDLTTLNFRLVISLSANETVYIRVRGYNANDTGSFVFYADNWEGVQ